MRKIQIILLGLIIIGLGLIFTQKYWVDNLVDFILQQNGEAVSFTEAKARSIAEKSCIKGGEALGAGTHNKGTKTWWFDANLNAVQEGCNPACVVSEETKQAEINWRCTGALPNDDGAGILPFDSGVTGKVLLGPTCPVMRNPPDPQCVDKPYQTIVQVIAVGSAKSSPFATAESDKEGKYKIMLPPGEYGLQAIGGMPLPRCETKNITIEPNKILETNLSCDTGIR